MRVSSLRYLLCVLPCLLQPAYADDNIFVYPPDNGQVLYIPKGYTFRVQWNSTFAAMNLKVFQAHDGIFNFATLLDNVSAPAGPNTRSYTAKNLGSDGVMHFQVTLESNGQSLNAFNSGLFYVTNASDATAISTSGAPTSTSAAATATSTSDATSTSAPAAKTSPATQAKAKTPALGIGLGVGLGVALLLALAGLAAFLLRRRRKSRRAVSSTPPAWMKEDRDSHTQLGTPAPPYSSRGEMAGTAPGAPLAEVDGRGAVYEAPVVEGPRSEVEGEAVVRYEIGPSR
ncbi:hypothetical protein LTR53_013547 [Teratosphaeriaceae sp. CCFEE 6253]|nr:hypothetical protein LTR53_013547 [Teratosphaeriaceae sp. CCFEE 6253]